MNEHDKHERQPAPDIRPCAASDREILHALLDKLLDNPGENMICYEVASAVVENGTPTINRRRFRLRADVWEEKDSEL